MLVGHTDSRGRMWAFDIPFGLRAAHELTKALRACTAIGARDVRKPRGRGCLTPCQIEQLTLRREVEDTILQALSVKYPADPSDFANVRFPKSFYL